MLVRAVLFHRSGRRRPHRGEPRQRRSDLPDFQRRACRRREHQRPFPTGQDRGFFTTVSCNGSGAFGNCTNTPIIWAVSRPTSSTSAVALTSMHFRGWRQAGATALLFGPTKVGPWPNIGGNANIVPTVSNGLVYVASSKSLTILKPGATTAAPLAEAQPAASAIATNPPTSLSLPFPQPALSQSRGRFIASMGRCSPSQIAMAKTD